MEKQSLVFSGQLMGTIYGNMTMASAVQHSDLEVSNR